MSLKITNKEWIERQGDDIYGATISRLSITVSDVLVTENINAWTEKVEDTVIVSATPLAIWFLENWWRIMYEPFQAYSKGNPGHNWRMAHELGAANHGYVWPRMAFFSDLNSIYIAAAPTSENKQSVRYINGINGVKTIPLHEFEDSVKSFVNECIGRLGGYGFEENAIKQLLEVIEAEKADPEAAVYRKIEAMMGYDPDEASSIIMNAALRCMERDGMGTIEELAPVFGKFGKGPIKTVDEFLETSGVFGQPDPSLIRKACDTSVYTPWKVAVRDAKSIREQLNNENARIEDNTLFDLLGVSSKDRKRWGDVVKKGNLVSVGIRESDRIKYLPRKHHPFAKRFEMSRFIGDFIHEPNSQWLVNTELSTARQKYQKAFAAALLCPINALVERLDGDYSDEAIMDASDHFGVSGETVTSVLNNNGYGEVPAQENESYHFQSLVLPY